MYIADLHIHSRYSRATSRELTPETLELSARRKGIRLLGTGDFTHPAWRAELEEKLVPAEDGLCRLKKEYMREPGEGEACKGTRFVVSGEISSIYKQDGRVRKVHSLILLPGLEEAKLLSKRLEAIGNIHSDGRFWGFPAAISWRSCWRHVRTASSFRPISGHRIFPCSGPAPASIRWRSASGTWLPISMRWKRGFPQIRP